MRLLRHESEEGSYGVELGGQVVLDDVTIRTGIVESKDTPSSDVQLLHHVAGALRRGRDDAILDGNGPCLPGLSVVNQAFPSVVVFPLCLTACHQRVVHLQPVHTDLHAQFGCFEAGDPALHYFHNVFDDRLETDY